LQRAFAVGTVADNLRDALCAQGGKIAGLDLLADIKMIVQVLHGISRLYKRRRDDNALPGTCQDRKTARSIHRYRAKHANTALPQRKNQPGKMDGTAWHQHSRQQIQPSAHEIKDKYRHVPADSENSANETVCDGAP